jgi:FMN phosphatase YigB (HAD superfamily)
MRFTKIVATIGPATNTPEKIDPKYYETMLRHFGSTTNDVIYFENKEEAVKSARSVGITTYHYNPEKKDIEGLKEFIDKNL